MKSTNPWLILMAAIMAFVMSGSLAGFELVLQFVLGKSPWERHLHAAARYWGSCGWSDRRQAGYLAWIEGGGMTSLAAAAVSLAALSMADLKYPGVLMSILLAILGFALAIALPTTFGVKEMSIKTANLGFPRLSVSTRALLSSVR